MSIKWIGRMAIENDFLDFNLKFLVYVGLWPDDNWPKPRKLLYRIYELSCHVLSITYLLLTTIGTYQCRNEIIMLLSNCDKVLVAYNFIIKIGIFLCKRDGAMVLVSEILRSGDRVTEGTKKLMIVHIVLITIATTGVVTFFSALAFNYDEMLVEAWMPFDPKKSTMNLITATQILAFTFMVPCLYRNVAAQALVCSLIMYMCDQLIELQGRLRSLKYSLETDIQMRNTFKEIVKKHVRLIRYSRTMQKAFSEMLLVQNLAVTLEICFNAMVLSVLNDKKTVASFLVFLSVALMNAYIYCYLGNEMIIQSEGIALAAYESSWTSWPVDLQKDLLLVIRVAQRPMTLNAGRMVPISLQAFGQMLNKGYSIFAVLNDVVD